MYQPWHTCRASRAPRHTPPLVPETESWHAFRIAFCKVELLRLRSDVQQHSMLMVVMDATGEKRMLRHEKMKNITSKMLGKACSC
ncbi:hypothetical protein GQ54DRAFT_993 [Martensiomyces pterosporus]|nr:hypothetical protein GQ54DRAFT_993 [Martensiomyces pterosporus]